MTDMLAVGTEGSTSVQTYIYAACSPECDISISLPHPGPSF